MKKLAPEQYEKPSRFAKLQDGDNQIRILDGIYTYKKIGARMRGRYIAQIIDTGDPLRPEFQKVKSDPKQQWGFVVYDHRVAEPRILEVGPTVGDALANLMKEGDWQTKDVIIKRRKTGPQKFDVDYTVEFARTNKKVPEIGAPEIAYYAKYFEASDPSPVATVDGKQVDTSTGEIIEPEKKTPEKAGSDMIQKFRARLFAMLRDAGIEGNEARDWVHTTAGVESATELDVKGWSHLVNEAQKLERVGQ